MKTKIIKKWTFELTEHSDGKIELKRINDGFNIWELIGVLEFTLEELMSRSRDGRKFKPDVVERKVIVDEK